MNFKIIAEKWARDRNPILSLPWFRVEDEDGDDPDWKEFVNILEMRTMRCPKNQILDAAQSLIETQRASTVSEWKRIWNREIGDLIEHPLEKSEECDEDFTTEVIGSNLVWVNLEKSLITNQRGLFKIDERCSNLKPLVDDWELYGYLDNDILTICDYTYEGCEQTWDERLDSLMAITAVFYDNPRVKVNTFMVNDIIPGAKILKKSLK